MNPILLQILLTLGPAILLSIPGIYAAIKQAKTTQLNLQAEKEKLQRDEPISMLSRLSAIKLEGADGAQKLADGYDALFKNQQAQINQMKAEYAIEMEERKKENEHLELRLDLFVGRVRVLERGIRLLTKQVEGAGLIPEFVVPDEIPE